MASGFLYDVDADEAFFASFIISHMQRFPRWLDLDH
jgi:hypothetical protein